MIKRAFLFAAAALVCISTAAADYNVSTAPTKTKILLEEFTGAGCYWCTDGHRMARQLQLAMPGEAYVVAIHTGTYAPTSGYEAGFTVDAGNAIGTYFKSDDAGYPSGMINRRNFSEIPTGKSYTVSRSWWNIYADNINSQDAPVNLYVKSVYNGKTNKLDVHVEGYYTAEQQAPEQYLSILWTQSDVMGYQNNGGKGNQYLHQHMLRGFITDTWGDQLDAPQQGKFFSKDYSIDLPAEVNGVKVCPEDIEVIAFVSTGKENILNVHGGKPIFEDYAETEAANLLTPDMDMSSHYGFNFFEAVIKSRTTKTITSATFDVTVNDVTTEVTIPCNITQFATTGILKVPATYSYKEKGSTKYSLTLKKVNGVEVDGGSINGTFQKPNTTGTTVKIELATDFSASQNRFYLKDADGNTLKEIGPFADGDQHKVETTFDNLEDGKTYCFEITDNLGDGMADMGKGYLVTRTGNGKLIDQYYTISGFGVRSFFTVDVAAGISHQNHVDLNNRLFDLQGRAVAQPQRGIFIMKNQQGTHKIYTK